MKLVMRLCRSTDKMPREVASSLVTGVQAIERPHPEATCFASMSARFILYSWSPASIM